jgi:hypothetical protein
VDINLLHSLMSIFIMEWEYGLTKGAMSTFKVGIYGQDLTAEAPEGIVLY